MLKSRFQLFTALSLMAHVGLFAGLRARRHAPPAATTTTAGGTEGAGAAAAVGGETFDVPEVEDPAEESAPGGEGSPIELDGQETPPLPVHASTDEPIARPSRTSRGGTPRVAGAAASEPPPPLRSRRRPHRGRPHRHLQARLPDRRQLHALWDRVPVGFYAAGEVTFYLAEDGELTHATASAAAAPAFRAAITRTAALMKHRLFTARGATTHLHMVVRVTDHLVNHGAFTIDAAGSFELPSGRRVSVSIVER